MDVWTDILTDPKCIVIKTFVTPLFLSIFGFLAGYPVICWISGIDDQPDIRYPAKIVFGSSLILCIIESFHRILNAWKYIEENHKNNRYSLYLKIKFNKV